MVGVVVPPGRHVRLGSTSPAHIPGTAMACSRVMPGVRSPSMRSAGVTRITG
jgi:hypothetical protein